MEHDLNKLCLSCMDFSHTGEECTHCHGRNSTLKNPSQLLPPGVILDGRYLIGRSLGRGGFGCTYLTYDLKEKKKKAIKEFMPLEPNGMVNRSEGTLRMNISDTKMFSFGEERFVREARLVHEMDHPNIVRVTHIFREIEMATSYYVMEYLEGETLDQYRKSCGGRIDYMSLQQLFLPILDALEYIHGRNVIHRDISPDNIYLGNVVKLLDFGSARVAFADRSQSLTMMLKEHYAPWEQYSRNGKQGSWTDIYALSATMYYCLTGTLVPKASDRVRAKAADPIVDIRKFGLKLPESAADAIMRGLAVQAEDRIQTAAEFRAALLRDKPSPPQPPHPPSPQPPQPLPPPSLGFLARLRLFFARLFGLETRPGPHTGEHPAERPVLYGINGRYAGSSIMLEGIITFGRTASVCQLVYPPETAGVSRLHCSLWIDQVTGEIRLRDEGATYGTYCNGRWLDRGETVELHIGDRFSLGGSQDFEIRSK